MNIENGNVGTENDTVVTVKPEIIFENDEVLVINKPAGLIVHSDGRTDEPSVAEWVLANYPDMKEVGEPWESPQGETILRPGIVHRLDRTTSGVMILAKTKSAHAFLKNQFQDRTTKKEYRALVYGHPKKDVGTIEAEIVRIRSTPPRWGVARPGEGKKHREAVTDWKVLGRANDPETGEKITSMSLFPKTGRTHQIRVHLKHLGHPIICDHLYAKGKPCVLGIERPALHAHTLTIEIPNEGIRSFEAPFPRDFQNALQSIAE